MCTFAPQFIISAISYINNHDVFQVEKMVQYLKQSAQSAIDNAKWMDATTKILAQNKVLCSISHNIVPGS